jgi:hypothetical protein
MPALHDVLGVDQLHHCFTLRRGRVSQNLAGAQQGINFHSAPSNLCGSRVNAPKTCY